MALLMLLSGIFVPFTMIIAGWMMWKHCPKEINAILGYRTKMSMMNKETWEFAHKHCGRLWFILGLCTFIPSAIVPFLFIDCSDDVMGNVMLVVTSVQMILLFVSVVPTHIALKKHFNKDGTKK